jgi:NAD-dependent DNA ligase
VQYLSSLLLKRKDEADYDMDGLVIVNDIAIPAVKKDNPDNSIAFKAEGEVVVTEAEYVEWNASKHGVLKPRVKVKPVSLCGVQINWATGFNAKFIYDNGVGRGAKLLITRSGDVIPYIKEVVQQAEEPDMPTKDYTWNDTRVDIILSEINDDVKMRKIVEFFKSLDAKFVGKSTIEKLYIAGFNTLKKILNARVEDLTKIEGIQKKSAQRIVDAVTNCITSVPLERVAAASGCLGMGFGERKMKSILNVYPDILDIECNREDMIVMIRRIGGFQKTAEQFVDNLPRLRRFLSDHPMITLQRREMEIVFEEDSECEDNNSDEGDEDKKHSLSGKIVVFTGTRDKNIEHIICMRGGKVTTSVSGKTNILVTSQRYSGSSKEVKAEQLGVEILTLEQFREKYL